MHTSFSAIATYPIGARDVNKTEFLGNNCVEQLFSPVSVIFLSPRDIYLPENPERSFGVIQAICPFS